MLFVLSVGDIVLASSNYGEYVAGWLLLDPLNIFEVTDRLKPEYFDTKSSEYVYKACLEAIEGKHSIEAKLIVGMLADKGVLEAMGGANAINRMIDKAPTQNISNYLDRMIDKYRKADIKHQLKELLSKASKGTSTPKSLIENMEDIILQHSKFRQGVELETLHEVAEQYIKQMQSDTPKALSTGYPLLNQYIGGWRKSDFIILAARTGVGKTAMALNFTLNALESGKNILLMNLEMNNTQLLERLVGAKTNVEIWKMTNGGAGKDLKERFLQGVESLKHSNLYLNTISDLKPSDVRAAAQRLINKVDIDLIVIDYLQIMSKSDYKSVYNEVSLASQKMKAMAKDLNVPVLALAQINRRAEELSNGKPKLHHLRDSGSLEQDSDLVLLMSRLKGYPDIVEMEVAKHRHGTAGHSIFFSFKPQVQKFHILSCERCEKNCPPEKCKQNVNLQYEINQ